MSEEQECRWTEIGDYCNCPRCLQNIANRDAAQRLADQRKIKVDGPVLLTRSERLKFAAWLRWEAESSRGIDEQLKTLGRHGEIIAEAHSRERDASLLIAKKLESIEDWGVGGDG